MTTDPSGYNTILADKAEARLASARKILALAHQIQAPASVLDVGCGHGAWLHVARELGADVIQGLDGPWIDEDALMIPREHFTAQALDQPFDLNRTFDLVISLEVAEHLPEQASEPFVDSLTRHGDMILFSAAIPFQGGQGHINEQWPGYWAEKFARRGYQAIDSIRPKIWADDSVFWWLQQNTILFMSESALEQAPDLWSFKVTQSANLIRIHPHLYMRWVKYAHELNRSSQGA